MLYRFQIELSNIDQGIYESLDFRVAQHPSESIPYLLTRTLAYALSYKQGLEFNAKGLGDPEGPAIQIMGSNGGVDLWIEIGNPTARKIHRVSKAARQVVIYTYKSAQVLMNDMISNDVHRAGEIEIYWFDPVFLLELEKQIEKNNRWSLLVQDGQLNVEVKGHSVLLQLTKLNATKTL